MTEQYRIGLTPDFFFENGQLAWGDIGLDQIERSGKAVWSTVPTKGGPMSPAEVDGFDAVLVNGGRVTAETVSGTQPPRIIARFGAGYDSVDIEACTAAGVMVTNTPDGVRTPVALSAMTLLFALAHRLLQKDRIARSTDWDERLLFRGSRLTGATVGIIGLGNIGREVLRLAAPIGMNHLAFDPYATPESAATVGAELTSLPNLLRRADYVIVTAALTPETHHLLGRDQFALMKPTAFFINLSRGPVVDEPALVEVLKYNRIAGAGLDVFEQEPIELSNPLIGLGNVILSPHALCWTDELAVGNGSSAIGAMLAVANRRVPRFLVNREVLTHSRFAGYVED